MVHRGMRGRPSMVGIKTMFEIQLNNRDEMRVGCGLAIKRIIIKLAIIEFRLFILIKQMTRASYR